MREFFTVKVDVEIDPGSANPLGFDFESHSTKTTLRYGIDMELREWGIKGFHFFVPEQDLNFLIEVLDRDSNTHSFECRVKLKECSVDLDRINPNSDLSPEVLNLKLKNMRTLPVKRGVELEADGLGELIFPSCAA